MENVSAYGAGLSGGAFDLNVFIKKPTVIFRILGLAAGALVWYSVAKGAWIKEPDNPHPVCVFAGSATSCSWGSALGFFAVAGAIVLLALDANFDKISSINNRKKAVIADLITSAVFAFLFAITFFMLFTKFSSFEIEVEYSKGLPKFAIFGSFLSVLFWGGAAFFSWRRYEEGKAHDVFAPNYDSQFAAAEAAQGDGYGYGGNSDGIGSVGNDSYQNSAPFKAAAGVPTNPFVQQEGYQY